MAHYVICDNKCLEEGLSKTAIENELGKKSNTGHTHAYNDVTGKPSMFPPANHTHDDRYYTETECNAKYKLKGDFAVLTGNTVMTDGISYQEFAFPSGFNMGNCVIVSFMSSRDGGQYAEGMNNTSIGYANGATGRIAQLTPDGILMRYSNNAQAGSGNATFYFKLVLMKV